MKIGILTFHYARNFGAVLQAYGLQEVLLSMGHDVQLLDYHNHAIVDRKSPFSFKSFISNPFKYLERLVNVYCGYKRSVKFFKDFENRYLNIYGKNLTRDEVIKYDGDILIVGSDQVWNPIITGGPDSVYWGITQPHNAKLMTYAASSGDVSLFENSQFLDVSKWLSNFSALSVREERLKGYLEKHTDKSIKLVVDPTLLAGREVFEKIAEKRVIDGPYVLLYRVEKSPNLLKIARRISKKYKARIVSISSTVLSEKIKNRDIYYYQANVREMLSLIKYAECVVALSFHGTALSVIFEKEFYSVEGKNMARVEALLSRIGLMDRIVKDIDDIKGHKIDYGAVRESMKALQDDSYNWLVNALGCVNKQ